MNAPTVGDIWLRLRTRLPGSESYTAPTQINNMHLRVSCIYAECNTEGKHDEHGGAAWLSPSVAGSMLEDRNGGLHPERKALGIELLGMWLIILKYGGRRNKKNVEVLQYYFQLSSSK